MFGPLFKKITLAAAVAVAVTGCAVSPTGENTLLLNSAADMNKMGAESFEEMKQKIPIEKDAKTNRYVQCVAQAVVDKVPAKYGYQPNDWEVVVFDEPDTVNAFALPGAKIGVYTGILKVAQNQDQLAAILGHEVSHVLAQHSNARMSQQQMSQLGIMAASMVMADRLDDSTQQTAVTAMGIGAQYGLLLPFSRRHESEADRMGQELMAEAGFDPREAVTLWQRMSAEGGSSTPELMSTHPANDTRIQQLDAQLAANMPIYEQARAAGERPNCNSYKPK